MSGVCTNISEVDFLKTRNKFGNGITYIISKAENKLILSFIHSPSITTCSIQGAGGLDPIPETVGTKQGIIRDGKSTHRSRK